MSTAITRYEPTNISEAMQVSRTLVASRLLPKAIATPEAAFAVIVAGAELGLTAMQSLRAIHIIEGKPTLSADLMLALCKRHEVCEYVRLVESTAERATYEAKRKGEPEPTRMSFTMEEARAAQLVGKDNWKKYPAAMLRARCIAAIVRAVFPDVFLGVYETDELAPATQPVAVSQVVEATADDSAQVSGFAARIEAATTAEELKAVAADIQAAKRAGALSPVAVHDLQSRYSLRKSELTPRPPSSPQVADAETEAAQ